MSIITKVQRFSSISQKALDKINPSLFLRANRMLAEKIGGELYAKYTKSPAISADTVSSITLGFPTKITLNSAHFRRTGVYVKIYDITDNGLWQLNGRQKIEYVEGSSALSFTVNLDTTNADDYTSGGKVIDAIWDEFEDAEAYFLLYILIPSLKEIAEGDFGVISPTSIEWAGGRVQLSDIDEIDKVRRWFYDMAISIIKTNVGSGVTDREFLILAI